MLTGKRIMLRAIEESHLPTLARWRSDGGSYRYFHEFSPISLTAQAAWFAAQQNNPREMNFAVMTPDGAIVGTISLVRIDRRNRRAELGRVLIGEESMRGQGYGREMTFLALEYAFAHLNLHKVVCEVIAENAPARELYRKFGFEQEGVLRQHVFKAGCYHDVVLLGLLQGIYQDSPGEYVKACRATLAS